MRLFGHELKKIWNPWLLIGVVLLSWMYQYMFMTGRFPADGHPSLENFEYAITMTEQFGTTLESDEFTQTEAWLNDLYYRADEIIRSDSRIAQLGYSSFTELRDAYYEESEEESDTPAIRDAFWLLLDEGYDCLGFKIQELEDIRDSYLYETNEGAGNTNIMSSIALSSIFPFTGGMLVVVVLITIAMLAPTLTRDRLARVDILQLASKCGRNIYRKQLYVMLFSVAIILLAVLAFGTWYMVSNMGLGILWHNACNSFMSHHVMMESLTMGQYYLMIVGFAILLGIGTALLMFFLSGLSASYIPLLAKVIPCFGIVGVGCGMMLAWWGVFDGLNPWVSWGFSPWHIGVPALVLLAGIILAFWFLLGRRRAEM